MEELERSTIPKLMARLLPILIVCYAVAFLDRINVSFAKLQMDAAIGLSETAFGLGAGLFFLGYFLVEIPSNMMLERIGARRWIARIMASWGVVSGAFAFIPTLSRWTGLSNEWIFYLLRLLLGVSEAGFYPGVIFYLTLWFPSEYKARVISIFMLAIPISATVGSPISGSVLNLTGFGLEGWQWLFLIEAAPAILMALVVLLYLPDRPSQARWLADYEIQWLDQRLSSEQQEKLARGRLSILQALTDYRILLCAAVAFAHSAAGYGVAFFLPTIIKSFNLSNTQTGFLNAVPFVFGAIGMILFARRSDRARERKAHAAVALAMVGVGLGLSGLFADPIIKIGLISVAVIGSSALPSLLWPLPASLLTGASAAAGIAAINSIGNTAGFFGPFVMGFLKDRTGDFMVGLLLLAACALAGAALVARLPINLTSEKNARAPDEALRRRAA